MKAVYHLILFILGAGLLSCASKNQQAGHHHEKPEHHHHYAECEGKTCKDKSKPCDMESCHMEDCQMFEKRCAYHVSQGNMEVKGKDEHKLEHAGHTYYFSSKDKMAIFKEDLEKNIQKANDNWGAFKWQQWRR